MQYNENFIKIILNYTKKKMFLNQLPLLIQENYEPFNNDFEKDRHNF